MAKKASSIIKKTEVSTVNYKKFITSLKTKIRSAQIKGAIAVNKELIKLYWEMGREIFEKQKEEGWGSNVLEKVAKDLQNEFPGVVGFSRSNVFYIRSFYVAYEKVQQVVGQFEALPIFSIPWGHNVLLIQKIKDPSERLWYVSKVIEHGWSRSMLTIWIENNLYRREGKAITNFKKVLPAPQSDLAHQSLKDPYIFDFLTLNEEALEKGLEEGLVNHIQKFLSERKVMISEGCDISELIRKCFVNVQSNQQRYILTGGPGAGKTSIINCLAQKGYFTVPEAATQIIEEDLNKGIKQPWRAEDYHLRMYKLILRRQMEVQQSTTPIAFFDRGHLDGLSYILLQKRTVYQGILDCIQAAIDNQYFSNKVFFIDSLGFVMPGPARDEDLQESLQKARCLEKNYKSMGYEIIHIPPGPVDERAQMIIDCIIEWGKNE